MADVDTTESKVTAENISDSKSGESNGISNITTKRQYPCDECGASFSQKIGLVRHKKSHTSEFKCQICGKQFSSKYDLDIRHMPMHTKEPPIKCSLCGIGFKRRKFLKEHVCSNVLAPVFRCEVCGDRFLAEDELLKHKKDHTTSKKRKSVSNDTSGTSEKQQKPYDDTEFITYTTNIKETISDTTYLDQICAIQSGYNNIQDSMNHVANNIIEHNIVSTSLPISNVSSILPISNVSSSLPISNNVANTGTGLVMTPIISAMSNYSNIGINDSALINMIPVQTQPSNFISYEQNTINTGNSGLTNVTINNSGNIVNNELLTMLISGNNLQNAYSSSLDTNLYAAPSVSNGSESGVLPTFQDTFAQNKNLFVPETQPITVFNTNNNCPNAASFISTEPTQTLQVKPELTSTNAQNYITQNSTVHSHSTLNHSLSTTQNFKVSNTLIADVPLNPSVTINSNVYTYISSNVPTTINSGVPTTINSGVPTTINSGVPTTINSGVPTTINSGVPTIINSNVTRGRSDIPISLNTNMTNLHRKPKKPLKCPMCPKRYYIQSVLDKHMVVHISPFVCQICGKNFMSKKHLENKHMLVHKTENNLKNNISNDLDDILLAVSSVDFVVEPKQNEKIEDLQSSISDSLEKDHSTFTTSPLGTDTGRHDKLLNCSICQKSYALQMHLDKHMIIHTNPFICSICGKKFITKDALEKQHMVVHEAELNKTSKNIQQESKLVDQLMPSTSDANCVTYTMHKSMETKPKLLPDPADENQLLDNILQINRQCSNAQEAIDTLNSQENDTSGAQEAKDTPSKQERPFSCTLCKKSYILESYLDKHMVIHNNPFICRSCGKKFATKLAVETHRKRFHSDVLQENISGSEKLSTVNISEDKAESTTHLKTDLIDISKPGLNKTLEPSSNNTLESGTNNMLEPSTNALKPTTVELPVNNSSHLSVLVYDNISIIKPDSTDAVEKPPKVKPHKCTLCTKQYFLKYNLDSHMKMHTNPVICKICGKKFANSYLLDKLHMPVHNVTLPGESKQIISSETPIMASTTNNTQSCSTNICTSDSTEIDIKSFNAESMGIIPEPKYSKHEPMDSTVAPIAKQCSILPDSVELPSIQTDSISDTPSRSVNNPQETSNDLIAQAILKDKPFECKLCNKRYSVPINLTKHMVIHLNPFVCKICGKKFLSRRALEEKHMPIHTNATDKNSPNNLQNSLNEVSILAVPSQESAAVKQFVTEIQSEIIEQLPSPEKTAQLPASEKLFGCPLCPRKYFTQTKLDFHFLRHSRRYSCAICGKTFKNKKILEEKHMKIHHSDSVTNQIKLEQSDEVSVSNEVNTMRSEENIKMTFDCIYCGKKYNEVRFLKKHLVIHQNPFICKICGKKFSSKWLLEGKHMLKHIGHGASFNPDLGIGLFKCSFCRKTYTFKKNLSKHLEGHKIPAKCKVCPCICVDSEAVKKHQFEHLDNSIPESTNINDETLSVNNTKGLPTLQYFAALAVMLNPRGDEEQLALGQKLAELTLQKLEQEELELQAEENETSISEEKELFAPVWISCPYCDKRYSQKQYLDRHIVVHTNPFVCKICGKAFASKYALEAKHMLMHTDEAPFKCSICERAFKELRRLRDHVSKKHRDITPHVCTKCGFRFREKIELKEHMKSHSKHAFKCGDCFKNYQSKLALSEHMKRHTGEKSVFCEVCGNSFVYQSTFDKHLLYTNKENKQYVCQPCSKSFTDKAQFYVIGLMFEKKALMAKQNKMDTISIDATIVNEVKALSEFMVNEVCDMNGVKEGDEEDELLNSDADLQTIDNVLTHKGHVSFNSIGVTSVLESDISDIQLNIPDYSDFDASSSVQTEVQPSMSQENTISLVDGSPTIVFHDNIESNDVQNAVLPTEFACTQSLSSISNESAFVNKNNVSYEIFSENKASKSLNKNDPVSDQRTKSATAVCSNVNRCVPSVDTSGSNFSFLKSALSKPVLELRPSSSNKNMHFSVPKDFKTFTDIMIERLVHHEDCDLMTDGITDEISCTVNSNPDK